MGIHPHNSNPCKNTKRYRMQPKERFLTPEQIARLNAVLARAVIDAIPRYSDDCRFVFPARPATRHIGNFEAQ